MDTLQTAYKILYGLEHKGKAEYMGQVIGPEKLGVSADKWLEVMQTLLDDGYISGVSFSTNVLGEIAVNIKSARITLKGAEYLRDNSAMRRFAQVATDVISIVKP